MPAPRAAAGAAIVGERLYVVGGVGPRGTVPRHALAFDLVRRRWRFIPGSLPREHLAVTAINGRVYALGGRMGPVNFAHLESYAPGARRWRRLPPEPEPGGGTRAATLGGSIVSVGGETPTETIETVYAFNLATHRWRRLLDLPTPRHGLGVVALRGRLYAIAGGRLPGFLVSAVNEILRLR